MRILTADKWRTQGLLALLFALVLLPGGHRAASAQASGEDWYQAQAFEAADIGVIHPVGVASSPATGTLFALPDPTDGDERVTLQRLSPFGDRLGTTPIDVDLIDPLNSAYYGPTESLFFFKQRTMPEMVGVKIGPAGDLAPGDQTVSRYNARAYGIGRARGVTFDAARAHLYVLDVDGPVPVLVRIAAGPGNSFDGDAAAQAGRLRRIRLEALAGATLSGIAFNPQNDHLYTLSLEDQTLYELTMTGTVVATKDIASLNLTDPQGMVFAASADRTDDPAAMHLFIADSGRMPAQTDTRQNGQGARSADADPADQAESVYLPLIVGPRIANDTAVRAAAPVATAEPSTGGQIVELSLQESIQVEAQEAASLVQVIDTSKATWSPSSPDPAGIAYRSTTGNLLISDSEVEENHPDFQGWNVFESDNSGTLVGFCSTSSNGDAASPSFSNEPTGAAFNPANGHLFFTDDNANAVFEVDLGADNTYCTADDIVTSLNTNTMFGSGDPEGLAYGNNKLFVSDGVNQEVYIVDLGANGVIGGNGDDADALVFQFDTFNLGLRDPEGIEYNAFSDTLFLVSTIGGDEFLVQTTTTGAPVTSYDLSFLGSPPRSGLAYGPGSQNPAVYTIYMASRGVDNGADPNENDGKVYEIYIGSGGAPIAPTADFTGTPVSGDAPLTVSFTDLSAGAPTAWSWDFGDGNMSTEQNPSHIYSAPGTYSVSLTVSNESGIDGETKADYVVVNAFVNDPPEALDDSAATATGTSVAIDVAANDSDVDGNLDPGSVALAAGPANGSVLNNGDGSLIYTPSAGFEGSDGFTYQICDTGTDLDGTTDADDLCDMANVAVTVGAVVFEVRVASKEDDAEERTPSNITYYSSDLELVFDQSVNQTVGMRFNGVTVPQGATIVEAYLQFQADETNDGATALTIQGQPTDNAPPFDDGIPGDLSSRLGTAAATLWSPPPWTVIGEQGDAQRTPDIAPVIQEIISRPGWIGGNSLALIITGTGERVAEGYDGDPSGAPLLHIEYTTAPVNQPPTVVDDFVSTLEDTLVTVDVLGNDSDAENDPVTIGSYDATSANGGTVSIDDGGTPGDPTDDRLAFMPAADFSGSDTFSYTASDGTRDSLPAGVTITVDPVNDAPVVVGESYSTDEETPLSVAAPGVLGNDSDVDDDPLTAVLVSDVSNGTLVLNGDGSFSYTPAANFNGSDSFSYRANDGQTDSTVATVTITVNGVNDAPTAVGESYSTSEDTTLDVNAPGVLANDGDVDGDPLTAALVSDVSNGTLTLNGDGSFSYTPDANFNGSDSFSYRAGDGQLNSTVATVSLTVNGVNDVPTAIDDSATTDEDTAITVDVLANDGDVDGDALSVVSVTQGNNGTVTHSGIDVTYAPDTGFSGVDGFTYTISDGNGGTAAATVSISVNAADNNPPTAIDDIGTTDEDSAVTIAVLANDSDADGDSLSVVSVTQGGSGSVVNNGTNVTYTPDLNFNGEDGFTYTISDGSGSTATAAVTVAVSPVNDVPVAVDDGYTTDEDTPLTVAAPGVLENDGDVDGDPLTAVLVSDVSNGTLTLNGNGSFSYTPDVNFNGSDGFTYRAGDGQTDSTVATVSLTVNGVNDAPVAVDESYSTDEETPLSVAAPGVLGNGSDADGDPLTAVLVGDVSSGALALNGDGSFTYTPAANYNGSDSFSYRAHDGQLDSNVATVSITVNGVNDAPVAVDDGATTDEDTAITIAVLANDSDVDGHALSVASVTQGGSGAVINNGIDVTYTPDPGFNGVDSFTYTISDGNGGTATATVSVTVRAADNNPPTAVDDSGTTDEDTAVTIGVLANDSDVDGDPLGVASVTQGSNGSVVNNGTDVSYTPDPNFNGADSFIYTISDGNGGTATATVLVTVNPVNDAPVAVGESYSTDEETSLSVVAPGVLDNDGDVDGDPLTAVLVSDVSNGTLVLNGDGSFVYTPAANYNGSDSFTYLVSDGVADSAATTVDITINPAANTVPSATDDSYVSTSNTTLSVGVPGILGNDTDADNDPLTAVLDAGPVHGTLALDSNGSFTYTPVAGFAGIDSFTYHASDGVANSNIATVTITVNPRVLAISPASMARGDSIAVTVSGAGFAPGAVLALEAGAGPAPTITNVVVVNSSTITAVFTAKSGGRKADLIWDVRVSNPNGTTGVLPGGFIVTP